MKQDTYEKLIFIIKTFLLQFMVVLEYITVNSIKLLNLVYFLMSVIVDSNSRTFMILMFTFLFFELSCTGVYYKLDKNQHFLVTKVISFLFLLCNIVQLLLIVDYAPHPTPIEILIKLTIFKCAFVTILGVFFVQYLSDNYFSKNPHKLYWYQETMRALFGYKKYKNMKIEASYMDEID